MNWKIAAVILLGIVAGLAVYYFRNEYPLNMLWQWASPSIDTVSAQVAPILSDPVKIIQIGSALTGVTISGALATRSHYKGQINQQAQNFQTQIQDIEKQHAEDKAKIEVKDAYKNLTHMQDAKIDDLQTQLQSKDELLEAREQEIQKLIREKAVLEHAKPDEAVKKALEEAQKVA